MYAALLPFSSCTHSILIIYCYVMNGPKMKQFKAANIYYLIASVGQESRHGSGHSRGCLHRLGFQSVTLRLDSRWNHTCKLPRWLLAGFTLSKAVRLGTWLPGWLLAKGCPHRLHHRTAHNVPANFILWASEREKEECEQDRSHSLVF